MYGCVSCTIKKAEHWRIDVFKLWYWEESWECLGLQGDPTSPSLRNQSWIFIERTDVEAETPILCPPDVKSWLIRNDPDAGKDWGWEMQGMTEDEMVGWHHQVNGHEFQQSLGDSEGQEILAFCRSWGHKGSDTAEWTTIHSKVCVCVFLSTNKKCRQCFPGFTNEEMSLREVVTYLIKGRGVIQVWLILNLCSFYYRKVPFSFLFLLVGQHLNLIPKYGSCFFIMSLCRGVSSSH